MASWVGFGKNEELIFEVLLESALITTVQEIYKGVLKMFLICLEFIKNIPFKNIPELVSMSAILHLSKKQPAAWLNFYLTLKYLA